MLKQAHLCEGDTTDIPTNRSVQRFTSTLLKCAELANADSLACSLLDLPDELLLYIADMLLPVTRVYLVRSCKSLHALLQHEELRHPLLFSSKLCRTEETWLYC